MVRHRVHCRRSPSRSWTGHSQWRSRSRAESESFRADRRADELMKYRKNTKADWNAGKAQGGNAMITVLMRSTCVAAILVAAGTLGVSAQQTIAPVSATPVPGPVPEVLKNYTPVTAERLKKPEDGNWLMFRRTYDGWGYSPLEQITPANVRRLQLVWSSTTGQVEGHQAPPIVNNGVMFVATPGNQLLAIDAKTGHPLWRYK